MPVNIEQVSADVEVEGGDAEGGGGRSPMPKIEAMRRACQIERLLEWNKARTRAWDFDDGYTE